MYTPAFFEELTHGTRESARAVVAVVNELLRPASVLDVGCGTGTWLAEWRRAGVSDLLGIDGDYVDRAVLQVPTGKFAPADLEQPFSLGRTFDLVQTLEVAEHLDEAHADAFVESLARHGETILFAAAIPGQGGTHHVNEQWPSYWAAKFAKAGYTAYDIIRPRIWTDPRVAVWYRQNILIFARERGFEVSTTHLDLVHPELWQSPGRVLDRIPDALATLLRRKLRKGSAAA
ncbi:MAG: class I SAM-dependent methyltransferase [Trebonia sp.]